MSTELETGVIQCYFSPYHPSVFLPSSFPTNEGAKAYKIMVKEHDFKKDAYGNYV